MQERRHQCDYDPLKDATYTQVSFDISNSKTIIQAFRSAQEFDRRAFCAYVLLKSREDPEREREVHAELQKKKNEAKKAQKPKKDPKA